jgi:hypothetical protein
VTDGGEGARDEGHQFIGGDVVAYHSGRAGPVKKGRDLAGEVRRHLRGGGAQVELGRQEGAFDRDVLGAGGHHAGQQREQGGGIIPGREGFRLGDKVLDLADRDREIQIFFGGEVPVHGAGADARAARDLVE